MISYFHSTPAPVIRSPSPYTGPSNSLPLPTSPSLSKRRKSSISSLPLANTSSWSTSSLSNLIIASPRKSRQRFTTLFALCTLAYFFCIARGSTSKALLANGHSRSALQDSLNMLGGEEWDGKRVKRTGKGTYPISRGLVLDRAEETQRARLPEIRSATGNSAASRKARHTAARKRHAAATAGAPAPHPTDASQNSTEHAHFLTLLPALPAPLTPQQELAALTSFLASSPFASLPPHYEDAETILEPEWVLDFDLPAGGDEQAVQEREAALASMVKETWKEKALVIYGRSGDVWTSELRRLVALYNPSPAPLFVDLPPASSLSPLPDLLTRLTSHTTFPILLVGGHVVGGYSDTKKIHDEGRLASLLETQGIKLIAKKTSKTRVKGKANKAA